MPDIFDKRRKLYRPKKKPPIVAQTAILNIIGSFPQGGTFYEIVDKVLQQYHPCINHDTYTGQEIELKVKRNTLLALEHLIKNNKVKTSTVYNKVVYHKVITHNEVMIIEED